METHVTPGYLDADRMQGIHTSKKVSSGAYHSARFAGIDPVMPAVDTKRFRASPEALGAGADRSQIVCQLTEL